MKKIFITDYFEECAIEKEILSDKAEVICLNQKNEEKFPNEIEEADGILVWHSELTEKTFKKLKKCKAIVRYGVGYDNIDIKSANKFGIDEANTPDYGIDEVADTTCAMILVLARKIFLYNNKCQFYEKGWQENVLNENIIDSTKRSNEHSLGIIGAGRIGSAVAMRMKSFKMKIGFYDPYVKSGYEKTLGVDRYDSLDNLIKKSTIISINATLNKETKGMVNKRFINKLTNHSILVNTARGAIVDKLDTLYEGIKKEKLGGVGLDVLPDEPPLKSEKLIKSWKDKKNPISNKILINPHAAYYSSRSVKEMRIKATENIFRSIKGLKLKNIIKVN